MVRGIVPDGVPVRAVLCFVGRNWPLLFRRPLNVRGTVVLWPSKLLEQLDAAGPLLPEHVKEIAARLSVALPPA
jgi:hypothetical protein